MKTIWIDGKKMAEEITQSLIKRINRLSRIPELDVIWIGDNPASAIYVRHKQKKAEYPWSLTAIYEVIVWT